MDKLKFNRPCTPVIRAKETITFDNHFLSHCPDVEKYEKMINHILGAVLRKDRQINPSTKSQLSSGNLYYCLLCKNFVSNNHLGSNQSAGRYEHDLRFEILERNMDEDNTTRTDIKDIENLFLFIYVDDDLDQDVKCTGNHVGKTIKGRDKQPKENMAIVSNDNRYNARFKNANFGKYKERSKPSSKGSTLPLPNVKSESNNNLAGSNIKNEVKRESNNIATMVEYYTDFISPSETSSPHLDIKKPPPSETKQGKGIKRKDCDGGDDNQN